MWVLFFFVLSAHDTNIAAGQHEFTTKARCDAAIDAIQHRFPSDADITYTVKAFCIPK